jgi:hypothetical protein
MTGEQLYRAKQLNLLTEGIFRVWLRLLPEGYEKLMEYSPWEADSMNYRGVNTSIATQEAPKLSLLNPVYAETQKKRKEARARKTYERAQRPEAKARTNALQRARYAQRRKESDPKLKEEKATRRRYNKVRRDRDKSDPDYRGHEDWSRGNQMQQRKGVRIMSLKKGE